MAAPSQADLLKLLTYDPNTGYLYWKWRSRGMFTSDRIFNSWNSKYANQRAFTALSKKGYHVGAVLGTNYRANRIIWIMQTGVEPIQVDHENGIRHDDRWVNLRNIPGADNQKNMKKAVNNSSGYTGVSWNTEKQSWDAYIDHNGSRIRLGRYKDINDAIAIRQQAELHYGYHPNHGKR